MDIDKLIKEIGNIKEGIKNSLITDDEVERIALVRLKICGTCPSRRTNRLGKDYCDECNCLLHLKSRSGSTCPLKKWDSITTSE